jgi:putative hydrolase of the HAD superfamily
VLFDLYETLVRFDSRTIRAARERMIDRLGVSIEQLELAEERTLQDRMRGCFGTSLDDEMAAILHAAGARTDAELVSEFRESELRAWGAATLVHPDVMPCLDGLRADNVRLGLVSNCSRLTRPLLEQWPFGQRFEAVILSCEVGRTKPDPGIFERAVTEMCGAYDEGVLVDDRPAYVDGAEAAGLRGCLIARSQPPQSNGHHVISDLGQLTALVAGAHVAR